MGGLTKEFFNLALSGVLNEPFNGGVIFEGCVDHKIPCSDPVLLRCGVYRAVGKLFAHAYMHIGVGCYGLSRAAVEYILQDIDSQDLVSMDIKDVPCDVVRGLINLVRIH